MTRALRGLRCLALLSTVAATLATAATARAWEPVAGPRTRGPRWSAPMIYRVYEAGSDDLPLDALLAEVHRGMLEWTTPDCTGAVARYDGVTTDLPNSAEVPGADNVIAFRESGWTYGPLVLAVTAPSFISTGSGTPPQIVAATMWLNGEDWTWGAGTSTGRQMNLYSVFLHEGGHYWGLGHTPVAMSVMNLEYSQDLSGLSADDIEGICSLYPRSEDAACPARACPGGYACLSGNCLWEGPLGSEPRCQQDADCAQGERCDVGQCVEAIEACVVDQDCAGSSERCLSGRCVYLEDPPPAMCMRDRDCEAEKACKAGLCVPVDASPAGELAVFSDCIMDADCASGLCRLLDGDTLCTAFCASDADCGANARCQREDSKSGLCGPPELNEGTGGSREDGGRGSAGCAVTGAGGRSRVGFLGLLAWVLAACFRRILRRRE